MSKKWTPWIPHTGDECPVDLKEFIKVDDGDGGTVKDFAGEFDWSDFNIPRFKRLLSNVEAGEGESYVDWDLAQKRLDNFRDALARNRKTEFEDICAQGREAEEFRTSKLSTKFDDPKPKYEEYSREGLLDKIDGLESDLENAIETAFKRGADAWCLLNYPDMYEKLVSADLDQKYPVGHHLNTAETKASEPETAELSTPPKPIITGPGEYETRGGEKIKITGFCEEKGWLGSYPPFPVADILPPMPPTLGYWFSNGFYFINANPANDIIGPWEEPKTEKPEQEFVGTIPVDRMHIAAVVLNQVLKGKATAKQEAEIRELLGAPALTHTEGEG